MLQLFKDTFKVREVLEMIIPESNSKYIINKEVVFTSHINEELNKKARLTSVINVSSNNLLNYLTNIIKLNHNTIFYEIAYDKDKQKVYFYTNKELRFMSFNNEQTKHFPLNNTSTLIDTINNLKNDNYNNSELINLTTIFNYLKEINHNYLDIKYKYELRFNNLIKHILTNELEILKYDFHNNTITLGFKENKDKNFIVKIENNNINLISSNNPYAKQIIFNIKNELINYYLEIKEFSKYQNDPKTKIRPYNCDFYIDISINGIDIYSYLDKYTKDLELIKLTNGEVFSYSKSNIAKEILEKENDNILNHVYIYINDLPNYLQEMIRKDKTNMVLNRNL